jgi:hypothetical protein
MKKTLTLVLLGVAIGWAQTPVNVERIAPDCSIYFTLSHANPSSVVYDNRQAACTTWTITYLSDTFAALSLQVNAAPDNVGVPGAFAIFPGVVVNGINPNVAVTQAATTLFGYMPWMRVDLTVGAVAGTVTGRLYGYRQPSVTLVPGISSGGALAIYSGCTNSLPFDTGVAVLKEIVPAVAGKLVRVCHISLSTSPAENVWISQSVGAACAGGTAALTGTYIGITGFALDLNGAMLTGVGKALCIEQSVAQATGGLISYSQY